MATRLYLPSAGAAPVFPAFDAGWDVSTTADRILARTTKGGSTYASKAVPETSVTVANVLLRQYVSPPLWGDQSIAGTFKLIARTLESATTADMRAQLLVKVVSADGQTLRGTLVAFNAGALAAELGSALANRKFPLAYPTGGLAVSAVNAKDRDRVVIEVGYRAHNTITTSRTGTVEFGDPTAAADLAENETGTTQGAPWAEFSQTLTLDTGTSCGRSGQVGPVMLAERGSMAQAPVCLSCGVPIGTPDLLLRALAATVPTHIPRG